MSVHCNSELLCRFKIFQNKKLKKRNNFKTNTISNEIMDLVNDSKWLLKSLSEKLIEGKKLKGNFIMDRSGWQFLNPLINLFFFNLFTYLFMAVLGLRFCARAFSSCGKRGPLLIAARGPLTIVASLVAEHRLQTHRLSNCGSRAQSLRVMWDLPRPGLEPVSPELAGRFSTTAPPGKPPVD